MIITLSRQFGSGGDVIAARIAAEHGLTLVDRAFVHDAARAAGLSEALLRKLMYEGRRSLAAELMNSFGGSGTAGGATARASSPLLGVFAPMLPPDPMTLEEAVLAVGRVIIDAASRGNVLVLGQGGQVWLRDHAGACHVQVIAPVPDRVALVAEREKISAAGARRIVRANDRARSEYLTRFHNVDWLDPLLYHIVVNAGRTPLDAAVRLIVQAAQDVAATA